MWHQFSLFNLKFLLGGKQSETIMRAASRDKSINPNNCFEIVLEDRGIAFELAPKEKLCAILDREMKKVTHLLTYLPTHSLTHLLTYSLTHLLTHSLTHLLTHSLTHSLTYLLTYLLTQGVPLPFDKWLSYGVTILNPQIHDEAIQEKTDRWLRQNAPKTLGDYHEVKCRLFCENVRRY